jgi:hypothetical protein
MLVKSTSVFFPILFLIVFLILTPGMTLDFFSRLPDHPAWPDLDSACPSVPFAL